MIWFHLFERREKLFKIQKSLYSVCSAAIQRFFHIFPKWFLCFTLISLYPCERLFIVLIKLSQVLQSRSVLHKRGLFKWKSSMCSLLLFVSSFFHKLHPALPPWSVVLPGTLMLSVCMNLWWLDAECIAHRRWVWTLSSAMMKKRGHLWPSRRVSTKVVQSNHIWEDVDRALALISK